MALPANIKNYVLNSGNGGRSAGATQLVATNLWTNPNYASAATGVTAANGTGGTSAITLGSYPSTPVGAPFWYVTGSAIQTWSVATTAVSGGMDFASISPGTGLLWVACDVYVGGGGLAGQRLQWSFTGTSTLTVVSAPAVNVVTSPAIGWIRVEAFLNVTVAGTVIPHLYAVAGTGGVNWPVGSYMAVTNTYMVHGSGASLPRFTSQVGSIRNSITVAWTGTANASTQTWTAPTVNGYTASGGALLYYDNYGTQYQNIAPFQSIGFADYSVCMAQGSASPGYTLPNVTLPTGQPGAVAVWVTTPYEQPAQAITLTTTGGLAGTATVTPVPGTWSKLMVTGTTAAGATTIKVTMNGTPVAGTTFYTNGALATTGTYTGFFNGSMPFDNNYWYIWDGAIDNSVSEAEYRGIWVEQNTGGGAPTVQVYVSGLGPDSAVNVQVTRTADNETWTVPGWLNRSVLDADTDPDFAPPLGRPVTYTLFVNGVQISQMAITVTSATGWVQDPYDPSTAMPIQTTLGAPNILTMGVGSLSSRTHVTNAQKATVMGAKRQYSISGQRLLDGSFIMILDAHQNDTSDQFKQMISGASILLFRGLPSWGSLPGLAYTDAPAQEFAINRGRLYPSNNALTQWTIAGDLVMPVTRKPFTSTVTNDQVQAHCAGVTNNAILARSGAKKNIEIKANPLTL